MAQLRHRTIDVHARGVVGDMRDKGAPLGSGHSRAVPVPTLGHAPSRSVRCGAARRRQARSTTTVEHGTTVVRWIELAHSTRSARACQETGLVCNVIRC
jgi:hypothetical protein